MSRRFETFITSVDDAFLEEAQLGIPRRQSLGKILGLAACLCIIAGVSLASFGGIFSMKSECAAESAPAPTYAAAATANESLVIETATEAAAGMPMTQSPLPANAVVCNFTVTGDEKQIDFSVGDMDFSLEVSANGDDASLRNILISDQTDRTITWYSNDGETQYVLSLIEGDYDLLCSTAEEIAENLGIEIADIVK